MKVLIVKTSSLGDVIHTLPALTDALSVYPDLEVDWLVEKSFSEPLRWHKGIKGIIEIEFRKWRKTPCQAWRQGQWQSVYKQLRQNRYDIIIDAQGLLKSALMAFVAKGKRYGLALGSSREPVASLLYHHRYVIDWQMHAIERVRQLFAQALNYPIPTTEPNYGLDGSFKSHLPLQSSKSILFLHGTTWDTKLWPLSEWQALGQKLKREGYQIRLPWGNAIEKERAEMIAKACDGHVLPALNLQGVALELINAKAVVAVDTGLGHLAAALSVPTISLYGATDAHKTGTRGRNQQHLSAQYHCAPCLRQQCLWVKEPETPPCYNTLTANHVMQTLQSLLQGPVS